MNQYRHSKSSLFLMEIILNILFFSILATFCVQIFFKGYQLSKSTEKLHQAVTACTSIAEICQSTDSPEETLSSIYPESMSLNETILIYYNKDFLACGKQNAVYRATVDFLPDQLATIHITFLDTSTAETLYELSASCYQPISLSKTGGMQYKKEKKRIYPYRFFIHPDGFYHVMSGDFCDALSDHCKFRLQIKS